VLAPQPTVFRSARLIGAFAPGLRVLTPVLRDVTQFVWRVTRRQADFYEVT